MTEDDIITALYKHFQLTSTDWACFHRLRLGTGWISQQEMDFWAMSLVPSSKFETRGFEIKVSRSDYRAEMRNPDKRIMAMTLCDSFYFATPKGLIKHEELPEGCGLYEVDDAGNVEISHSWKAGKPAKLVCPSWPFFAAILRRQHAVDLRIRNELGLTGAMQNESSEL